MKKVPSKSILLRKTATAKSVIGSPLRMYILSNTILTVHLLLRFTVPKSKGFTELEEHQYSHFVQVSPPCMNPVPALQFCTL